MGTYRKINVENDEYGFLIHACNYKILQKMGFFWTVQYSLIVRTLLRMVGMGSGC